MSCPWSWLVSKTPASVAAPSSAAARTALCFPLPLASTTEATVNPSGSLWRKTARKITAPSQGDEEPRRNRDAVKKGVNRKAQQNRVARMKAVNLFGVGFFTEMKMRRQGVLKKVDEEVADQHKQQRVFTAEPNRFGNYLDKRHR